MNNAIKWGEPMELAYYTEFGGYFVGQILYVRDGERWLTGIVTSIEGHEAFEEEHVERVEVAVPQLGRHWYDETQIDRMV